MGHPPRHSQHERRGSRSVVVALLVALAVAVAAVVVLTRGPFQDEIAELQAQSLGVIDPDSDA